MNIHIEKAIKALKKNNIKKALSILESKDRIYISWSVEDVMGCAESTGYKITKEQAKSILQDIEYNYDPEYGVSWEDITPYLESYEKDEDGE